MPAPPVTIILAIHPKTARRTVLWRYSYPPFFRAIVAYVSKPPRSAHLSQDALNRPVPSAMPIPLFPRIDDTQNELRLQVEGHTKRRWTLYRMRTRQLRWTRSYEGALLRIRRSTSRSLLERLSQPAWQAPPRQRRWRQLASLTGTQPPRQWRWRQSANLIGTPITHRNNTMWRDFARNTCLC